MAKPAEVPDAQRPVAVVLGLCPHGLATARSLHRRGITVHAIEASRSLPGTRTRAARISYTPDFNNGVLLPELLRFRAALPPKPDPVLIPINDTMVRTIGDNWDSLKYHYRLSWGTQSIPRLLPFLEKTNIESRCKEVGIRYPESSVFHGDPTIDAKARAMPPFPLIAKPTLPLSQFKARLVNNQKELDYLATEYRQSLPFLLQRWIPGDDERLVFGALLLDHGKVTARFEGQKLQSHPVAMGQTTAARCAPDNEVHRMAAAFFQDLELSGPVSAEFKRDTDNSLWLIEPTVGRTDFWVGCCVANGVDFPYLNYLLAAGLPIPESQQRDTTIWYDTDRDPLIVFRLAIASPSTVLRRRVRTVYACISDPMPSARSVMIHFSRLLNRFLSRFHRKR